MFNNLKYKMKINRQENEIMCLKAEIYDLNEKLKNERLKNKLDKEMVEKIKKLPKEIKKEYDL